MKSILLALLSGIVVVESAWAGTYEKLDGKTHEIKTTTGDDHTREGHLGPGANLRWADLHRANLRGANLKWADLRNANLGGAELIQADLSGTYLAGATLSGADLRGARVNATDLSGADLRGAKNWDQAKTWSGSYYYRDQEPEWPAGMQAEKLGIIEKQPLEKK
jgi:uncharacterized protein YjbI with pentapeptide repeats